MSSVPARPFWSTSASGRRSLPSAKNARLPVPGDTIAGKYSLVRQIGEGGMGVVFEAIHLRLKQRIAIKVLRPDVHDFDEVLARFEREAQVTAQLRSIHAARVIDVDMLPGGLPYIVLEFLEGRDLDAELEANGAMAIPEGVDVVMQVAEAMAEAHTLGIVHRDLKPSNLFVCRANGRHVVKILDFGISRTSAETNSRLTATDAYIGTPMYASPEQLRGAANADARSDIWSLGIVLFELLTGRAPFEGAPMEVIAKVFAEPIPWPLERRPEMPRELARVVLRALQRDPAQRFQTMREFASALAPFNPLQNVASTVAADQRGRGRLGEILVSDGLLTQENLELALGEQGRSGKLLGRVLLDMGLVAQADLLTALAKQQGIVVHETTPDPIQRERKEREAETVWPSDPAAPLPRKRNVRLWIALAVGLPMGILCAIGVASILRPRSANHAPSGLVAPGPAVAPQSVVLAPANEAPPPPPVPANAAVDDRPPSAPSFPGAAKSTAARQSAWPPPPVQTAPWPSSPPPAQSPPRGSSTHHAAKFEPTTL